MSNYTAKRGNTTERLNQLFITDGRNRHPVEILRAGDIGCMLKLKTTLTNHTLSADKQPVKQVKPIEFPTPKVRVAIEATSKRDDEKMSEVLAEL
ncbi:hypothetical protein [Chitinophaga sp. YR627]|uniref:hypothetical protein n=1 Tax=Chitinophaga sp. YR627 TaxID=1881041 RepID=UPI000B7DE58E|nr:hypothetical protein [Chitinophaga sp. YR627]